MCPGMPHPRWLPYPPLISAFRARFEEKLGRSVDTQFWRDTGKVWHFQRLVSMDSLQDYRYFEKLYDLVYEPDKPANVAAVIRQRCCSKSNQRELVLLWEDDHSPAETARREKEHFIDYYARRTKRPLRGS